MKEIPNQEGGEVVFLESLLTGDMSSAIEHQEKRGQSRFINSEVLPRKVNGYQGRFSLEKMGVIFGENADDLFVYVQLPEGWKKEPTDHSMWSRLVDEQGRERAMIFYKAAFYDRDAFINVSRRLGYTVRPIDGWENKESKWACFVTDCGEDFWVSDPIDCEPPYNSRTDGKKARKVWLAWLDEKDGLTNVGKAWLDENYPNWEDPTAYWD